MVSARWVHYAQFIEAAQLWLERPRLSGGRPRAATIFGIAAARMGGDGRAAVVARLALSYCAVTCVGRGRFSFRVVPGRGQLSWYGHVRPTLRAGERWHLTVRLKQPHGLMNPGGFDYEAWLFRHHLRATGYVRPETETRRLPVAPHEFPLLRARQALADAMEQTLGARPYAGIVEALAFGETRHIPPQQWEVLTATRWLMPVAVSGSHITLFSWLV